MLFSSYEFIFAFLPITIIVFELTARKSARFALLWLLAVSLFFYGWWDVRFLLLLIGSAILNYLAGLVLANAVRRGRLVNLFLTLAVLLNVMLIGYFKYRLFFVENLTLLTGVRLDVAPLLLPLGISFFTFEQISYLIDIRRGGAPERDLLRYGLFVTFFPRLVAGPILRASEILPQLPELGGRRQERVADLAIGLTIFAFGLFKKAFLADGVAPYVGPAFETAATGGKLDLLAAWAGALAYTFQLYFDFSGYSDMAIGAARCFGLRFPANFVSPYKATSIIDFWRRWHTTLSRFLRDYVYISLGGNRRGSARRYANLLATMLLGGLWHGANWTFVAWGGLHGVYLITNHGWLAACERSPQLRSLRRRRAAPVLGWLLTFLAVVVAWVLFRAPTLESGLLVLHAMAGQDGIVVPLGLAHLLGPLQTLLADLGVRFADGSGTLLVSTYSWVAALMALALLMPNTCQLLERWSPVLEMRELRLNGRGTGLLAWQPSRRWALATAAVAVLGVLSLTRGKEFLYWQF